MSDEPITVESVVADLIGELDLWRDARRGSKGNINSNVFCAGLYVTECLGRKYPLLPSDYLADSQVKGAGGPAAQAILRKHGEDRPFLKEGGELPG